MNISGYTILEEINRGPITTVYRARQEALDRIVLLKVLNKQWWDETDLVERFRREAKIYARLKHPNIVTVFDFGTSEGGFYLAMEFVEGRTLGELIRQAGVLPFPAIHFTTREILKGLAYAHERGVIHRDIKPSNIMIGDDGRVKLADFGLATLASLPRITDHDSSVGTPAYMSPEQAQGGELTARSDLFSLGATLHEMCTGQSPFMDENLAVTINKILSHHPPPLAQVRPDIPAWFAELTADLLQKSAEKRPESCAELLSREHFTRLPLTRRRFSEFLAHPREVELPEVSESARPVSPAKPKFRWVWLISSLLLIAVIGYRWLGGNNNKPRQPVVQNSIPVAEQTTDSTVEVKQPKTPPPQNTAKKAEVKKSGGDAHQPVRKIPPKPGNEIPGKPFADPGPGLLTVICYPWAEIFVDGEYRETTPLSRPLELSAGEHRIEFRNPGYLPQEKMLQITPGGNDTLAVNLRPAFGYLLVRVQPWGYVLVDGDSAGITPLPGPLQLSAGRHVLEVHHPSLTAARDTFSLAPAETLRKIIRLE